MTFQPPATDLLQGPFGDPDALRKDLAAFHSGVNGILHEATGTPFPEPAGSVLAHSVWRTHLDQAFKAAVVRRNIDESRRILDQGADLLRELPDPPELACGDHRYGLARGWLTSAAGDHQVRLIQRDLQPHTVTPLDAGQIHVHQVTRGIDLLFQALGEVAAGVVDGVQGALIVRCEAIGSAFIAPVPVVSVLNESILADPVAVADAVLHEACHQKLYDLMAVRHLVRPDYDDRTAHTFAIPWQPVNGRRRRMDSLRIVSALHVYAHVMALMIALARSGYHHPSVTASVKEYWARARFFWLVAEEGPVAEDLGPDTASMLDWIFEIFREHTHEMHRLGHEIDNTFASDARSQVMNPHV